MCPAFGSLRVGLRMRRTATVLSGSACCVYGLTFTSHFYGARRSVGYVPFNSETLVTGKLFEDIREAVFKLADPALYDTIVVTNLCVPTASGVPLQLLPKEINGVRIIGIDVPGFGVPTHAEAKDVLAGAMLSYARARGRAGPGAGAARGRARQADRHAARRDVPGRSGRHRPACSSRWASPPARSCRRANGASSMRALDCAAVAAIHPFYTASDPRVRGGRPRRSSARRRSACDGTAAWLDAIGAACGVARTRSTPRRTAFLPAIRGALAATPIKGRITAVGLRGLRAAGRRGC